MKDTKQILRGTDDAKWEKLECEKERCGSILVNGGK